MKVIAIEEAFAYPPIVKASSDAFAALEKHPALEGVRDKLQDLSDIRLADMDAAGIDVQVISHTAPGPDSLEPRQSKTLAPKANDALAEAVASHPDRFVGLAALPMSDPDAAATELERAIDQLGFRGALINGMVQGRFLDDPAFAPVLARAEGLGVPLYLHPSIPPQSVMQAYYGGLSSLQAFSLATAGWGWHSETALHTLRLIIGGGIHRYPLRQVINGQM
jgi:uncharacterized protein